MSALLKLFPNKKSSKIRRDIFFKTKGCSRTIKRSYLYGTSFGALESIMATLLKLFLNKKSSKIRRDIFLKTKKFSKLKVVVGP